MTVETLTGILGLLGFIALTASTGIFVAIEFALTSLEKSTVDEEVRVQGDSISKQVQNAHKNLSFVLSGAQLGITLTTLATGYLAEPILARYLTPLLEFTQLNDVSIPSIALILSMVIATTLSMVYGELLPKNLAISLPMKIARLTITPITVFDTLLSPVIKAMNTIANWVIRLLGMTPAEEIASARSTQELDAIVRSSADHGEFSANEATLLIRSLKFGETSAEDLMTPRSMVEWCHDTDTAADLVKKARDTGFSRFPVAHRDLDDAISVVHVKDALSVPAPQRSVTKLRTLAKKVPTVPSTLDGDSILNQVRTAGSQLVFIADEYGGIAGIITMEDLIEEILGEVWDEHDDIVTDQEIQRLGQDWELSGLLRIDELSEVLGTQVEEGPYETLGGLIMFNLGRIPHVGDKVTINTVSSQSETDMARFIWKATVRVMDDHRVDKVNVRKVRNTLPDLTDAALHSSDNALGGKSHE